MSKRVPDSRSTTAERRALAEEQCERLSLALARVGSSVRPAVVERSMTSADGDEWSTGTFAVVVDGVQLDANKAIKKLSRLRKDAAAELVHAALHDPKTLYLPPG
jgi:hypothetical protein